MTKQNLLDTRRWGLATVSVCALVVVVVAPAAASWHGLVGAGREVFGLSGGWEYVVPLTLDGAALYAAALSIRAILSGDSAVGARVLTAVYALAAAGFNGWHAATVPTGNVPSALFFAGASLSAVVLWDVTLRAMRRDQLRDAGCIEAPLPRFRLLRWLVDLPMTARAWRLAVIEQISDPAEALRRAREHQVSPRSALAERVTDHDSAFVEGAAEQKEDSNEQGSDADGAGWRRIGEVADHRNGVSGPGDVCDRESVRGRVDDQQRLGLVHERSERTSDLFPDDLRALSAGSKADAVRTAFEALGRRDVPAALAWLSEHGVSVDRSYAYTVTTTSVPHSTGQAMGRSA